MWNKIAAFMILVTVSSLLLTPLDLEARGGGRGGGGGGRGGGGGGRGGGGRGGGGGAYRGGNTMNRTPSMSRASSRPSVSQNRPQVQPRPSAGQGRQQAQTRPAGGQARQAVQQRPSAANRTELRNQVNQHIQSRPAQNIDKQAFKQKAQNFTSNRGDQINHNRQLSDKASDRLRDTRPGSKDWFNRDFFDRHDIDIDYVGSGINWWRPAGWAALAAWGSWNWSTPYYYDDGGYVYPVTTTEAYPQPVEAAPVAASTTEEWLPLGVFAVAHNAEEAAYTDRFIQLALNRSGEIAGVLYNATTDQAQDLTGTVDTTDQKAYWSLANRTGSPIASTGLYNLTEDQTPVNVAFADGSNQTWTLVRLKQEQ